MSKLNCPYEIHEIDEESNVNLLKYFKGEISFIQIGPKKYFFPSCIRKYVPMLYNFQPRPDDIWLITYPKSGTTLTQELIWLLENNLNFQEAKDILLANRFPFFEYPLFVDDSAKQVIINSHELGSNLYNEVKERMANPVFEMLENAPSPRFIKTHLPFSLLSPNLLKCGCKIIYVARNPKDVAVSFYHHYKLFRAYEFMGNFPIFWECFKNDFLLYSPYFEHVKEGWQNRNNKNMLFLFYEDYINNLNGSIKKLAQFLNKTYSEDEYERLEQHVQIQNFKKNPAVNLMHMKELKFCNEDRADFIRLGVNGDWKNYFTEEMAKEAENWIGDNLKEVNIPFPQ